MGAPWRRPPRRWPVQTEAWVRFKAPPRPDPPCAVCGGAGKVRCGKCRGRGRTNHPELALLPHGEWPQWCWFCRGSGLSACARCLGTGERRGVIGFHLPDP
eukprot:SM001583S02106  [mRNA]  locus=s1583:35:774:+ [translate_table: standard]